MEKSENSIKKGKKNYKSKLWFANNSTIL